MSVGSSFFSRHRVDFLLFHISDRNVDFAMPSYSALDDDMAEWLWRKSEEITGVKFEDCVTTELLQKPFTVQFATNSLTFKQH